MRRHQLASVCRLALGIPNGSCLMTPTDSPYVAYFSLFVVLWGILFLRYVLLCCLCGVGVVQ